MSFEITMDFVGLYLHNLKLYNHSRSDARPARQKIREGMTVHEKLAVMASSFTCSSRCLAGICRSFLRPTGSAKMLLSSDMEPTALAQNDSIVNRHLPQLSILAGDPLATSGKVHR